MYTHIIVHYDEIGLKKKNRGYFENSLVRNLRQKTKDLSLKINKQYGRIVCLLDDPKKMPTLVERFSFVSGVAYFSFGVSTSLDILEISQKAIDLVKNKTFNSFKIETKRGNKSFSYTSMDVNKIVGEKIQAIYKKKVNLSNPDKTIFIEICEKNAFIYDEKHFGISGLPIREDNKVICSLSGGLDSPVSAYMLMKRGCQVVFAHIQNNTQTNKQLEEKITSLVKTLTNIQLKSKLLIIPFSDIQKKIIMFVPSEYRMIVYRRFMMKIIEQLSKKENAFAIVTGDSVGQVASQTLENIGSIYDACSIPIFSPLIGLNKEEIVTISKKIKTYEHSIKPYPDCCSFMVADHPKTKTFVKEIKDVESKIPNKQQLIDNAIKNVREKVFRYKED